MSAFRPVIIDTNVLLVSISKKSPYHIIWSSFLNEQYDLCVSNEILNEYEEVISRKMSLLAAQALVDVLLNQKNVIFASPTFHFELIKQDKDDNKFVDCAIASNAIFIVSDDKHFEALKYIDFPKVEVISLNDFLAMLKQG